jgi:tripartite-type tricarboxylate transporter receptor subunit TctC
MKKKNFVLVVLLFIAGMYGLWAAGQGGTTGLSASDWPRKPIQVIVPFSPGGDTDFNGRAYVTRLGDILGQPVIVVNIGGNNGAIGATQVKNTDPDGYTVLFTNTALSVAHVAGSLDFGFSDLELACIGAKDEGFSVCVRTNSPYTTLQELMESSRRSPNQITMACPPASVASVVAVMLNRAGGQFNLVDVGDAPKRVAALLGGHVDAIVNALGTALPYAKSGDWRILAVASPERNKVYGDIPTAIEQGYRGVSFSNMYFFAFPKGTPKEIVEKFSDACQRVNEMTDYRSSIQTAFQQTPFFSRGQAAYELLEKQEDEIRSYDIK